MWKLSMESLRFVRLWQDLETVWQTAVNNCILFRPVSNNGCFGIPGTKVLMKSASKLGEVKEELVRNHREAEVKMVENCGMPEEHIYENIDEIPETAGYYTLLVVKEPKK